MHCKTCKHWQTWPAGGPTVGECKRIQVEIEESLESMPRPNEILVRVHASEAECGSAIVMTRDGFGCTLHESK